MNYASRTTIVAIKSDRGKHGYKTDHSDPARSPHYQSVEARRPRTGNSTGGTFQNNGNLTIDSEVHPNITGIGGMNVSNNDRTFTKQGTGTTIFHGGVTFINSRFVDVQEGPLDIKDGGMHTVDFSVADGATSLFSANTTFRKGEVFIDCGCTAGSTSGRLYFRDTDETPPVILLDYSTVTSGLLLDGAFYRGGVIECNLALRGALVRDENGGNNPIEVIATRMRNCRRFPPQCHDRSGCA